LHDPAKTGRSTGAPWSCCAAVLRSAPGRRSAAPSSTAALPTLTAELGMTANAIRQAKARVLRRLKEEVGDLFD
jgi:hypothetical protein